MPSLNKVMLIGNLTRDPEVRYTPKGSAVCDMAIAVNRRYTNDNGDRQEEVTFLDVVLWGKTAELAGQYLAKGRPVFIEGRLQMDTWDDRETGQKRSKIKIVAENLQFLGTAPESASGPKTASDPKPSSRGNSSPSKTTPDDEDDDIPF